MVRSRQWTIYGVVYWQQRSRLCRERLRSGGERAWESRGELRSWQADSKTARWSWTMRMEMSSGEKGWQSVPAATIHCTALQLQAYRHALGARCFKLVGVLWVLGFRGTVSFCWALLGFSGVAGGDCRPVQTLRPKNWEAKRGKEAWVGKCTSANRWVEAPGSQACTCTCSSTGWSCHGPRPTTHLEGKERTLGLGMGFRAVRFGDADWGRGPRTVWRLFLCASGLESSRLERDPSPRRGNRGNAARSLSVLSWPSSPFPAPWFLPPLGPPVPPCLPRLLHRSRSRFPTAHHLAFRQLELGRASHWASLII